MFANWLRKYFGGVRLFMSLLVSVSGLIVVFVDVVWKLGLSAQIYGFMSALVGYMAVFVWKDSERPAGAQIPQAPAERIGGAD